MKKIVLLIGVIMCSLVVNAQSKVGYIDSREILSSLPEAKIIDSTYKVYHKTLIDQLNKMADEFKIKSEQFIKDSSNFLPSIKEVKRKELSDDVTKIKQFQEQADKDLATEKEKLLKPLLEKIKIAIDKVVKEGNYDYIVDIANTPFVYANEKLNVTSLVKKKIK